MIAFIVRALLAGLWRPVAAILGALGLYAKGRADARAKAAAKADRATIETIERIEDAKESASAGGAAWHDRLRDTRTGRKTPD